MNPISKSIHHELLGDLNSDEECGRCARKVAAFDSAGMCRVVPEDDWLSYSAELSRLGALETRLFQMIAMGDEISVEAFTDLAKPDTDADRDERRERAMENVSPWVATSNPMCLHGLPKSVSCSMCLAEETLRANL